MLGHYLNGTGLLSSMLDDDDAYVIIETPRYFQQPERFVTDATTTLETFQAVLTLHTLSTYAGALSDAFAAREPR
ncbi:hypothetical protein PsorP6_011152 [Peronosclerospora sorghi]|uniref:Uncharacterized protein n=1 Tax=Peronosclerospora sorghi TaxID=230839 RepID=A0ACC0VW58_9STRA|nr:hypothetical protein PsorP6_011152 [Peronosclerospora sorghi]